MELKILLFFFLSIGQIEVFCKIHQEDSGKNQIVEYIQDVIENLNLKTNGIENIVMLKCTRKRYSDKVNDLFDVISRKVSKTNPVLMPKISKVEKNKLLWKASIIIVVSDAFHPVKKSIHAQKAQLKN